MRHGVRLHLLGTSGALVLADPVETKEAGHLNRSFMQGMHDYSAHGQQAKSSSPQEFILLLYMVLATYLRLEYRD